MIQLIRNTLLRLAIILVLATPFSSTGLAQFQTGEVSGFVSDKQGATLLGAVVKVVNAETRVEHRTLTDESGYYILTNLMPGKYEISIEMPNFQKVHQLGVNVDAHTPHFHCGQFVDMLKKPLLWIALIVKGIVTG